MKWKEKTTLKKNKNTMNETSANQFRQNLKSAVDKCIANHDVLKVKRRKGENFVVIGENDWNAIAETLYLNQIPGLVQTIQDAAHEPLEEGTALENLQW
ncbi:MAG: type II toxin-antitoxin system Phd/YefM family antitoxin [Deltaproteobacteria bacterium]|nr:type II toxin-antitoxin system Phd/YefM family antitoxin [Deltaproteobacteria bacterium]